MMAVCKVCFRHCDLDEGQLGFCKARIGLNGEVTASNYGRITSLALDPIEKKPLRRFLPGSKILSVGSYGCNLRCPFCQNYDISWSDAAFAYADSAETLTPYELTQIALANIHRGNIGVAFTYNEPLVGYEFVMDTARMVHENGMKNVLVSSGMADLSVLEEIAPYIDAMNIDLKGFTEHFYKDVVNGSLDMVLDFIKRAVQVCHVELTTLIIPGENDTPEEMRDISAFIAGLKDAEGNVIGPEIPLHITRFFPRFHMTDRKATDVELIYTLVDVASERLKYVYPGNV
ncbi:MAG: AmmeMemoRadiSam system radical SAM enzyme [Lachnospiraceae bacterium]|nr:AmmeMemoRadiSam system radical SAM enzyme [Lachnospiraceae bacterium]